MYTDELEAMEPIPEEQAKDDTGPVVMIAGPFGSGMEELASMLAERLNVPLYDPHKLEEFAKDRENHEGAWFHLKKGLGSFFEYWIGHLHEKPGMSRAEHMAYLRETLQGVTAQGGVLVGVCTHAALPGEHLFRIHVGASPDYCARHLAETRQCGVEEALAVFHRLEEERARFLHDVMEDFDVENIRYDLVFDAESMTTQRMLEECVAAMSAKQFFAKAA